MTIHPPYGGCTGSLPAVLTRGLPYASLTEIKLVELPPDFFHPSRIGYDLAKAIRELVRDEHTVNFLLIDSKLEAN